MLDQLSNESLPYPTPVRPTFHKNSHPGHKRAPTDPIQASS